MLFFNANFICYYFYPTKKREEPNFLRICTDLELRSSSPAQSLTFMLKYINIYEEKNAEET